MPYNPHLMSYYLFIWIVVVDVLSEVLQLLRLKAHVYFYADFCGSWSISSPNSNQAKFHIVERGTCWLHMANSKQAITLRSGDLVFFANNARHIISESPLKPDDDLEAGIIVGEENAGPTTRIICGNFDFDSNLMNPILSTLPEVIHIKSNEPTNAIQLESLMRFIYLETESDTLGSTAVVDKLCDILFVQIIRSWLNKNKHQQGFLAALADPQSHQALKQFHAKPGETWTVELLAQQAGMSRSAFAKRFHTIMAKPPMEYVAHWRMQCAYELLITSNKSMAQLAEMFSYQSEASFRKAFKQHIGLTPGAVKKAHRSSDRPTTN